ncbi:hypothetical protein ACFLQS_00510 [Actinomycetota bacterium]
MTKKERIFAALANQKIDRIPWTMYQSFPPWGSTELDYRNHGLSMIYQHFPVCTVHMPDVEVTEENKITLNEDGKGRQVIVRRFKTPVGEISAKHEFFNNSLPGPGDLIQKFGSDIDAEILSWVTEFPFKSEADYEVLEFIYSNMEFKPTNEGYLFTEDMIGEEGVIFVSVGRTPFQMILYELMGPNNCFLEHASNPDKFNSLYRLLYERQKEKYKLAAKNPGKIIWSPDNITGSMTPPKFFKEYVLPFYNEMADILHAEDKYYGVHMDGMLDPIKDLIGKTKLDIIEAFTPPPMGDLSVAEALELWPEKIVWVNFPASVIAAGDKNKSKKYTIDLLKSVAPGDRMLIGCTENYPLDKWAIGYGGIKDALEQYGSYPVKI